MPSCLIYGSYGYTGKLIVEQAIKEGLKPILAGRNKKKLEAQASTTGLPYQCFDLTSVDSTHQALKDVYLVVHCAGPFIHTFKPMVEACLATKTHYIDITGEVEVIEQLSKLDAQAKQSQIMVLPGAGFDVVPTDCLAAFLKDQLPDATSLTLALNPRSVDSSSGLSHGTARTAAEGITKPSLLRENGQLKPRSQNMKLKTFDFGDKKRDCIGFTWGDLSSAYWSTHIPHIETYMSCSKKQLKAMKKMHTFRFFLKWRIVQYFIKRHIDKTITGPSKKALKEETIRIYGVVTNAHGESYDALLETKNGYAFTALSVVSIMKQVLEGNAAIGFATPSTAYSKDFMLSIPGTRYLKNGPAS